MTSAACSSSTSCSIEIKSLSMVENVGRLYFVRRSGSLHYTQVQQSYLTLHNLLWDNFIASFQSHSGVMHITMCTYAVYSTVAHISSAACQRLINNQIHMFEQMKLWWHWNLVNSTLVIRCHYYNQLESRHVSAETDARRRKTIQKQSFYTGKPSEKIAVSADQRCVGQVERWNVVNIHAHKHTHIHT